MIGCQTLRNQVIGNGFGAITAQRNVDRIIARTVGVTGDGHLGAGAGLEFVGHLRQQLLRCRGKDEPVGAEIDRGTQQCTHVALQGGARPGCTNGGSRRTGSRRCGGSRGSCDLNVVDQLDVGPRRLGGRLDRVAYLC